MDKRRRKRHQSDKESVAVVRSHRTFLEKTPGGLFTVGRLERAVDTEAAQIAEHENCRWHYRAAVGWCRRSRRTLAAAIRHITTVGRLVDGDWQFAKSRLTNDEQLIARAEAVLEGAAPYGGELEQHGMQPGFLETVAEDLRSFKAAKAAVVLAVVQYTEASAAFDRAYQDARHAIAVLEGILLTSEDAPVGAQHSLRAAKRIGPRMHEDPETSEISDVSIQSSDLQMMKPAV